MYASVMPALSRSSAHPSSSCAGQGWFPPHALRQEEVNLDGADAVLDDAYNHETSTLVVATDERTSHDGLAPPRRKLYAPLQRELPATQLGSNVIPMHCEQAWQMLLA